MSTATPYAELEFEMDDGVVLKAEAWGADSARPVLLSHGGGQTRHAWKGTGEALASQGWYAVAYDHRGHGESGWSPDGNYNLDRFARDQYRVARSLAARPVLVGASLGGLSALAVEGMQDVDTYRALILVDIVPQMNKEGAHRIMSFMEENMREGFADLNEAAEVIARYTGREKRFNGEGLKKNLRLDDDGRYRWHWDPNFLGLRSDIGGAPERLMSAAESIDYPIFLVRGVMSEIVTEDAAKEFLQTIPRAEYIDVQGASHMVAGDRNDIFTAAIIEFMERI